MGSSVDGIEENINLQSHKIIELIKRHIFESLLKHTAEVK